MTTKQITTQSELSALVAELLPETVKDVTPYQLAGITSKVVGKYVREQMLFQYVAKEFIPSTYGVRTTKKGDRRVKVILRTDAVAWLTKYATKQLGVK